jgi:hypothetical protein
MELKDTLGICGDPLVGRALTLLLRGSGYKVRFLLLAQCFWEPQALKDIRLSVLTPTPELSTERRSALVRWLKEISEARGMPVLELVTPFLVEARREEARHKSWHMVTWPCRIQELEQWIEAAWLRHYETKGERIGSYN